MSDAVEMSRRAAIAEAERDAALADTEAIRERLEQVIKAIEDVLDDADQITDTLQRPNRIAVWGVRRALAPFGGKPHRWPMPAEFCAECGHHTYGHDDECLQPGCDCLLSAREAAFGRDEDLDDAIGQALWEQAITDGESWAEEQAQ
jgi:hypothetical protein